MGKLLYLEGIRGLAALWVFFIHYFPVVSPGLLDFFMLWQPRGWSVHMFFVLSGRVLTAAILKRNDSKRIASAFIRRPFRLALPVIGVILTNMVLFPIATLFGRDLSSKYNEIYTGFYGTFIKVFHFLISNAPQGAPLPGPCWTLKIEYDGSLVTYIMTCVMLHYSSSYSRWCVLLGSLSYSLWTHDWMGHFIIGLILAHMDEQKILEAMTLSKRKRLLNIVICLVLFIFFLHSPITLGAKTTEWIRSWQVTKEGNWGVGDAFWEENTSMAIVSFLCLLMVETNPFLQKFFGWKGFVYLGRISFSMYLFHPTVIETIGLALKDSVPKTPFFVLVQILLVTLAVFICSDVLTKLFDEPSIHVTKWVETDLLTPWSIRRILAIPGFWMRILGNLLRSVVPFGYTKVSQETEIPQ